MSERRGRACRQRGRRGGGEKERVVGGGWAGRRVREIWILRRRIDRKLPLGSGNKNVGYAIGNPSCPHIRSIPIQSHTL